MLVAEEQQEEEERDDAKKEGSEGALCDRNSGQVFNTSSRVISLSGFSDRWSECGDAIILST